jgi:hypothetical protein
MSLRMMAVGLALREIAPQLELRLYRNYIRDQSARIGVD